MNKQVILLTILAHGQIWAADLPACIRSTDCNDEEVCVSYANCSGEQVKRCLARTCYRSGVGCPNDVVCNDKHCSTIGCSSRSVKKLK